jgi:SsrA-binding protein
MAKTEGIKILADNRRARFKYSFLETFEAGIVLTGSEVKSAKAAQIQLGDAYASITRGEIWLHNAHISPYAQANRNNHEPMTVRKLLLHREQINKLIGKTREKGQTLIPTKVYLKNGLIKVEIALAKGKQDHDKRETIKNREQDREARQAIMRRR